MERCRGGPSASQETDDAHFSLAPGADKRICFDLADKVRPAPLTLRWWVSRPRMSSRERPRSCIAAMTTTIRSFSSFQQRRQAALTTIRVEIQQISYEVDRVDDLKQKAAELRA